MMYHSSKTQAGFSLVEMLVSISILLMVIVGPMTVTTRASKSSSFASEQVEAFFLAQEGLELAQMARDNYMLENLQGSRSSPWADFKNPAGTFSTCYSSGCGLVWAGDSGNVNTTVVDCANIANCKLYYKDGSRSRFSYTNSTGSTETLFTRKITFTAAANAVAVDSTVTWRTGSLLAEQKVSTQTYLYNIYDKP